MKEKLETVTILNPICQKCRKKDTCNNKTLCACFIPKEIKEDRAADIINPAATPIIITPEMVTKQLQEDLIKKSLYIGIDMGTDYSKSSCMNEGRYK